MYCAVGYDAEPHYFNKKENAIKYCLQDIEKHYNKVVIEDFLYEKLDVQGHLDDVLIDNCWYFNEIIAEDEE